MQKNIETKNIENHKFIIELRFDPKAPMLDKLSRSKASWGCSACN